MVYKFKFKEKNYEYILNMPGNIVYIFFGRIKIQNQNQKKNQINIMYLFKNLQSVNMTTFREWIMDIQIYTNNGYLQVYI